MRRPVLRALPPRQPGTSKLAAQSIDCPPRTANQAPLGNSQDLERIISAVGCPNPEEISLRAVREEYSKIFPAASRELRTSRNIQGLTLQGHPEELDAVERIVSDSPPVSWSQAGSECGDSARCALTRAFGNEEAALRAMLIQKQFGYTLSLNQKYADGAQPVIWSAVQLKAIHDFFKSLPAHIARKTRLREVILYPPSARDDLRRNFGFFAPPAAITVPQTMTILLATENHGNPVGLLHTFVHEFGHAYDFSHPIEYKDQAGFNALSGWNRNGHAPQARFVEPNSEINPEEDFADAFRDYFIEPQLLRSVDENKFQWMKKQVFQNEEMFPPGMLHSPALDRQISTAGGYAGIMASCVKKLDMMISPDNRLFVGDPTDRQLTRADVFFHSQPSACFSEFASRIAKNLAADPAICQAGGARAIEAHLNTVLRFPLEEALKVASLEVENAGDSLKNCSSAEFVSRLSSALAGKLDLTAKEGTNPELERAIAAGIASKIAPACKEMRANRR
jgi:hypothetical protein